MEYKKNIYNPLTNRVNVIYSIILYFIESIRIIVITSLVLFILTRLRISKIWRDPKYKQNIHFNSNEKWKGAFKWEKIIIDTLS